ncbi:glyoxylate/hydroxypyruvate reductase A [Ruegeria sp. EL01]|jgi:glyoxylate/hydroxypyruvate reductase A|uniref:2-hydroxyacid dehydrogenase n=1 Tax=Ruegeria sp. EL01 TaxID=2107578 RepID=UPI000EA829C5|nr:glyoxylate/hydroxypyruvate reductase A [Ruegeria sp. EL01]
MRQQQSTDPVVVPFLSRADKAERERWIAALGPNLHPNKIVANEDLSSDDRRAARFAIVANPEPDEVAALPNLVWVQSLWAGVEGLLRSLPEHIGIARLVDPNLACTMAEAVLAWTLYLHRDMPAYARQQTRGLWQQRDYRAPKEVGVGLLGLGELGRASAALLSRHGYRTMGWARSPKDLPGVETFHGASGLDDMLAQTDIAVILLPLTPQTEGLVNAERLGHMPNGGAGINFGRGPVLDTNALVAALDEGRLSHAVLDVFETEPLPPDDPLWRHSGITVLPHISAPTGRDSAAAIASAAIHAFVETGAMPNFVDRKRGY